MDSFLVNALLAGGALALVAGPLGCIVVWRRMAYFGDTLAHAALLGIALALAADLLPMLGVALMGVVLASLLYWLERFRELSNDVLLGILSHTALAAGLVVLSLLQSRMPAFDLYAYLFGDILAVSRTELSWLFAGVVMILLLYAYMWKALVSISVHEELARIEGISVRRTRFLFMLLLALGIAVAIKAVGLLLITALLIIPAAGARLLSRSPLQMVVLSVLVALIAVAGGLTASLAWDLPAGPAIVLCAGALFLGANLRSLYISRYQASR